jgi:hypothetical protein
MERMWNKLIKTNFMILSQYLPGVTEGKKKMRIAGLQSSE